MITAKNRVWNIIFVGTYFQRVKDTAKWDLVWMQTGFFEGKLSNGYTFLAVLAANRLIKF